MSGQNQLSLNILSGKRMKQNFYQGFFSLTKVFTCYFFYKKTSNKVTILLDILSSITKEIMLILAVKKT